MVKALANRNFGIGFDQIAVIFQGGPNKTTAHLKFWNSDGSPSATCGNATRCIAKMLMEETNTNYIKLSTDHKILHCKKSKNGTISVNMGMPDVGWAEIPLAYECDPLHLPIDGEPVATNFGNPHCTFFVKNISKFNIAEFGRIYETHALFPEKTNVQLAEIIDEGSIKIKVWERGTGVTMASGSSSCAVAVAAIRRGLSGKENRILLDGGELKVYWGNDGVWLSGETAHIYDGVISEEFLFNWKDCY